MDTGDFRLRIRDLTRLKEAININAPRQSDGSMGEPYASWVRTLDKEIALAWQWIHPGQPPPAAPQNAGDAQGALEPTPDRANDQPTPERHSDFDLRALFPSPIPPTDTAQLQDPQPANQLLPLLCRVLLLKEFPEG